MLEADSKEETRVVVLIFGLALISKLCLERSSLVSIN
jgi:uncharacterized membrane protein (Fun14 family)